MNLTVRFLIFVLFLFLISCARPVQPGGGPKDTTPPRLLKEKSSPPDRLNFVPQTLNFTFDEFIVLDKADQQILISPPLQYKPTVKIKDKTVVFNFDEKEFLKPNTTYIINFGESVKDFTEGNPVPDFRYVFSTGDVIDSLQLNAEISEAGTDKPADKTVFMLYSDFSDSVAYKTIPDYAGRTDKNGMVTLRNMKPGKYQAVALKDENLNYKYDLTNEKAGFYRDTIHLPYSGKPVKIRIFGREVPSKITAVDSASNQRIRIITDPSTAGFRVRSLDDSLSSRIVIGRKFIDVYYEDTTRRVYLEVTKPGFKPDTIQHKLSRRRAAGKLKIAEEMPEIKPFPFTPDRPVILRFNTIVTTLDTSRMKLTTLNDLTGLNFTVSSDTGDINALVLHSKWMVDSSYLLRLNSGAITDLLGNRNDSMVVRFKITDPSTLGSIKIRIDSLNPEFNYIIQLSKSNDVVKEWKISGKKDFNAELNGIPAETYQVDILEDRNKNGKIDKGNFALKEDPENIFTRKLDQLRQNWSIDVEINMKDFQQESKD